MKRTAVNTAPIYSVFFRPGLFIAFLAFCGTGRADDSPNTKYEKRLNNIYQMYNSSPTDPTVWEMAQSQSGRNVYKTQKGDTLWDISEMMFGDGNFWPKVWSMNRDITNPHELPPGTELSFSSGTIAEAPAMVVNAVQPGKSVPLVNPDVMAYTVNVEIPAPGRQSGPLLGEFPNSIPNWVFGKPATSLVTMDMKRPDNGIAPAVKNLEYYISESKIHAIGEVTGTELDLNSATEFQYVYVKLYSEGEGKTLTVLKDLGEIQDPYSNRTGVLTQVQGTVEILKPINSKKGLFRALVKKSLSNIEIGSKLVVDDLPTYTFSHEGQALSPLARLIGGYYNVSRSLFGLEAVVFLNRGAKEGIIADQILPVYQFRSRSGVKDVVRENPLLIGKVRIIRTTPNFSTAVVVQSNEEMRVGDGTSAQLKNNSGIFTEIEQDEEPEQLGTHLGAGGLPDETDTADAADLEKSLEEPPAAAPKTDEFSAPAPVLDEAPAVTPEKPESDLRTEPEFVEPEKTN